MTQATVGTRYQIVIPKSERRKLGIRPHSLVLVEAREDHLIVRPAGRREHRGIGRELASGRNASDYVTRLRREWEARD